MSENLRDWKVQVEPWIQPLSEVLREPGAELARLRPPQAAFLLEGAPSPGRKAGAFIQGRMGIGKTLALALAPLVWKCERPLLLGPGGILREVRAHIEQLRAHWKIPVGLTIVSYSAVSLLAGQDGRLEDLFDGIVGPDGIFPDEADKLANIGGRGGSKIGSAVARIVRDYRERHPECVFGAATGTSDRYGMRDYWHLIDWCLGDRSPLPRDPGELEIWARVIDEGNEFDAPWVGEQIDPVRKPRTVKAVRAAYRAKLRGTPGIIIADDQYTGTPLQVTDRLLPTDPKLEPHFQKLRELWQRPDDLDLLPNRDPSADPDRVEGMSIWQVARRMARGLCYVLDPLPPLEWRFARRDYFAYARELLESGLFYTEYQVRQHAALTGAPAWLAWEAIEPSYEPKLHQKTLWLSSAALDFAANWGEQPDGGIIFTDSTAFARELARRTGWDFYGPDGVNASGRFIESAPARTPIIASRKANGTGRNLQYQWNRMLFEQIPAQSAEAEQNIARVHREGLETWAKSCDVDVMVGCQEDLAAIAKIFAGAHRIGESIYDTKIAHTAWKRLSERPATWAFDRGNQDT